MWTKEEIGQIIKKSRISAGLTQKQVATSISRPQQTIASWESGKSQPDANTLFELFQVLGCSVDEAFGFTKQPFEITKYEIESIKKFRTLDWHGQEAVGSILDIEYRRCNMEQIAKAATEIKSSKQKLESAKEILKQKEPTLVTEDGLNDIESLLMLCTENMDPGQKQMFLEQWCKLSKQQIESSAASDSLATDDKAPESEIPDQS